MTVRDLLSVLPDATPLSATGLDVPCTGVTHDSRQVRPGVVFVALQGRKADGTEFVPLAVAAGAAAVIAGRPPSAAAPIPWIVVADARQALALLAAEFFGQPSRQMRVVGI